MKYPKKVMTISELIKTDDPNPENNIGYSRDYLLWIARNRNINERYKIAWKGGTGGRTSTYFFDTENLEKYRAAQCTGE